MGRRSSPPPSCRYAAIHLPRTTKGVRHHLQVTRGRKDGGLIGKMSAGIRLELALGAGTDGRTGAD